MLSIIIPCYNAESTLDKCILSIYDNESRDFEIILVDNGSTDNTWGKIKYWESSVTNILAINEPLGNQSNARNAALNIAKGEYLMFIDSDDYLEKYAIDVLLTYLKGNDLDLLVFGIRYVFSDSQTENSIFTGLCPVNEPISLGKRLYRNQTICNKIISKNLIQRLNLKFPEGLYHEDQYFITRVYLNTKQTMVLDKILYNYVKSNSSVSGQPERYFGDLFEIYKLLLIIETRNTTDILNILALKTLELTRLVSYKFAKENSGELKNILSETKFVNFLMSSSELREFRLFLDHPTFIFFLYRKLKLSLSKFLS